MIHVILKLKTNKTRLHLVSVICIELSVQLLDISTAFQGVWNQSRVFFLEGEKQIANHIYIKIFIIIFLAIFFKRKNSNFKLRTKLAKSVKKIFFFLFRWLNILKMALTICSFLMNFKLILFNKWKENNRIHDWSNGYLKLKWQSLAAWRHLSIEIGW